MPRRGGQIAVGVLGTLTIATFLVVHVTKDLRADVAAWYFHSTWLWILVMAVGTAVFVKEWSQLRKNGADVGAIFSTLPSE